MSIRTSIRQLTDQVGLTVHLVVLLMLFSHEVDDVFAEVDICDVVVTIAIEMCAQIRSAASHNHDLRVLIFIEP